MNFLPDEKAAFGTFTAKGFVLCALGGNVATPLDGWFADLEAAEREAAAIERGGKIHVGIVPACVRITPSQMMNAIQSRNLPKQKHRKGSQS